MKAIIISEAALETTRALLVSELSQSLAKREEKIKSGDVTGTLATPDQVVHYHVQKAFDAITRG